VASDTIADIDLIARDTRGDQNNASKNRDRQLLDVGRPEIQNFVGAIAGKKAGKGIFITTSDFHDNAREYAASLHQKLVLVDDHRLAELMIDHNIGVAKEHLPRSPL
jgi:restriction endonuclease Mrr